MPRSLQLPLVVLFASLLIDSPGLADGPKDNIPDQVRPVPPIGIELPAPDRAELQQGLDKLNAAVATLVIPDSTRSSITAHTGSR